MDSVRLPLLIRLDPGFAEACPLSTRARWVGLLRRAPPRQWIKVKRRQIIHPNAGAVIGPMRLPEAVQLVGYPRNADRRPPALASDGQAPSEGDGTPVEMTRLAPLAPSAVVPCGGAAMHAGRMISRCGGDESASGRGTGRGHRDARSASLLAVHLDEHGMLPPSSLIRLAN